MNNEKKPNKEPSTTLHKVLTVVGIVLCVILIPILIMNCILIVKSVVNKDEVPSIGDSTPLIVLSDSMYPEIKGGDIIIVRKAEADEVKVGDVISFFSESGSTVNTHRVEEIYEEDGVIWFRTKGDNNNTPDKDPTPEDRLVGIWSGERIAGIGHVALFMQTTPGLIVCVGIPLLLLIGYDIVRRKIYDKKKEKDVGALMAELEALKAEKAKQTEQKESDQPEAPTEE